MDFPWYTHHGTSFNGGFIAAKSLGNSMEFRWFRRHGCSMVYKPWNIIPWEFHRGKNAREFHGVSMVQTPWFFDGINTMDPHSMGFHRGKNPWEIHGILVAQTPWIFHGACTMELHSMGASYGQKNPWKFCGEFP